MCLLEAVASSSVARRRNVGPFGELEGPAEVLVTVTLPPVREGVDVRFMTNLFAAML